MKLDCQSFIGRLDDYLDGRLRADECRVADAHVKSCVPCRDLWILAKTDAPSIEPPPDLTEAILSRTSGPVCESARERLCDFVDRSLSVDDRQLLSTHLQGCADCDGLSNTLARLSLDLPELAELEPDPAFLHDVLARTSGRRSWTERLSDSWQALLARPRLALEGAYLGTGLFVLVFGVPSEPLDVASRALDLVRAAPSIELRQPATELTRSVRSGMRTTWDGIHTQVEQVASDVAEELGARSGSALEKFKTRLGTLIDGSASDENDTTESDETHQGDDS